MMGGCGGEQSNAEQKQSMEFWVGLKDWLGREFWSKGYHGMAPSMVLVQQVDKLQP